MSSYIFYSFCFIFSALLRLCKTAKSDKMNKVFSKKILKKEVFMKISKTNAMRLLESKKIPYEAHNYETGDGALDGVSVAEKTGQNPDRVFKTLVTHCGGDFFVFCIPVNKELDLKLAAKAAGQKHIEMIPAADITKVTGYVKGGCSPFGMKKKFPTFLDESAFQYGSILVSGGKIGLQIEVSPSNLIAVLEAKTFILSV